MVEDDHDCACLLEEVLRDSGFVVARYASGEGALRDAARRRPLAVVLDVALPGASGYEICHELREQHGDALPIVILSGFRTDPVDRTAGLLLGADEYLVKPFTPGELVAHLRSLIRRSGGMNGGARTLTRREHEILALLAEGLDHQAIAERLVISPTTVRTHIEHVLGKLGVHSRAQAVALAYRDRLLT